MDAHQEKLRFHESALSGSLLYIVRSPQFSAVLGFIGFGIVYFFAFRFAISFGPRSYSPLWLPAAVLLCTLLATRTEQWWLFILGIVAVRLLGRQDPDFPLWLGLVNIAIDAAKGLGAAVMLRRFMANPLRFDTPRDFGIF